MNIAIIRMTFAIALVLVLTATGLWAGGADEEEPAAAADKKYVTDPTTGKVVSAPEYGGTLTFALKAEWPGPDSLLSGGGSNVSTGVVTEKLAIADWGIDRDKFAFKYHVPPAYSRGALAESWSQPDPLTIIIKVRQGVRWHDKAPMNGRELTAQDIEFNYHRLLGMGSGFTEKSPNAYSFQSWDLESIEVTDKWTVVFKLKEPYLGALTSILGDWSAWIYPPEVIKEHGDISDWRNLVGTGPMMLTDWTKDSSLTWDKNPDYWAYDEKYAENRLPYIDQLRNLIMPEVATQLAALRTGKLDYMGVLGNTQIRSLDQVESLKRTNPEIVIWPWTGRSDNGFGINVQLPYFSDIRVRKAMQMAINLEEINNTYFGGYADTIPQGQLNRSYTEVVTQFEDWPEDVKKVFDYDPEGAEKLLDEAGYKRGADGIRFKTKFLHIDRYDLNYVQLVFSYWNKIGIDVAEIDVQPGAEFSAKRGERDFEMINAEMANYGDPVGTQKRYTPGAHWNSSNVNDPVYTAKFEAALAATTLDEQYRLAGELNQYGIEEFWSIWTPNFPAFTAVQPWLIGFNNEVYMGNGQFNQVLTRLWIDSELKEAMGY